MRMRTRLRHQITRRRATSEKLHLGCGSRLVPGWLNVDLSGSDFDVDLACGWLPWKDDVFSAVVCQQVIEHLDLLGELLPLLKELRRVCRPGCEIWLGCPDMAKICKAYSRDLGASLLAERIRRWPDFSLNGVPTQQIINVFFHQNGEHKNMFDIALLEWVVTTAGFVGFRARVEDDLLSRFPSFQRRGDDDCSTYVSALVPLTRDSVCADETPANSETCVPEVKRRGERHQRPSSVEGIQPQSRSPFVHANRVGTGGTGDHCTIETTDCQ